MITPEIPCILNIRTSIDKVLKKTFTTGSDDKVLFSFYGPGSKSDNSGHLV